jgi:intracellular septation protein
MIPAMQVLIEFLPVLGFLVAYMYFGGIYVATVVLMVAMPISLAIMWLRLGRMPTMLATSTVLVLLFGAATLALRDARFIQWKPTIFMWVLALAFLGSAFIGRQPLAQRLMHNMVGDAPMSRGEWLTLNTSWVLYGVVAGLANILVAFNASEKAWVNFKFFGLTALMFVFLLGQVFWLHARGKLRSDPK